jgi:hypothetical protein
LKHLFFSSTYTSLLPVRETWRNHPAQLRLRESADPASPLPSMTSRLPWARLALLGRSTRGLRRVSGLLRLKLLRPVCLRARELRECSELTGLFVLVALLTFLGL